MTGSELKATAIQLYGQRRWSTSLAEAIGKSRFQVWRYSLLAEVPKTVELAVSSLGKPKAR